MTDTTWEAELAIGCAACGAPAGSPCLNDRGKQVPYMHIDRVSGAVTGPVAAVPETAQPDPQVVAWMRDRMSEAPYGMTAKDVRAYREANGLSAEDMTAAYCVAARKPLTVADIPAGQGAASLFLIEGDSAAVWFKKADGRIVVAYLRMDYAGSHAKAALWERLAATLRTVTEEAAP